MKTKFAKKILSLVLSMGILVSSSAATVSANAISVPSEDDVAIECNEYDLSAGNTTSVAIYYGGGQGRTLSGVSVSWSVSNTSAAKIYPSGDTATLKILKNNAAFTIRANVAGRYTLTESYETYKAPESATSVALNTNSVTIAGKGNTARVTVHIYPDDGKDMIRNDSLPSIISSNSSVATGTRTSGWNTQWSGGYVTITARGSGSATITVKCSSGPSASCHVTVNGIGGGTTASTHYTYNGGTTTSPSDKSAFIASKSFSGKTSAAFSKSPLQSAAQKAAASAAGHNTSSGSLGSSTSSGKNAALVVSSLGSETANSNVDFSTTTAAANKVSAQQNNTALIIVICVIAASIAAAVAIILVKKAKAKKQ